MPQPMYKRRASVRHAPCTLIPTGCRRARTASLARTPLPARSSLSCKYLRFRSAAVKPNADATTRIRSAGCCTPANCPQRTRVHTSTTCFTRLAVPLVPADAAVVLGGRAPEHRTRPSAVWSTEASTSPSGATATRRARGVPRPTRSRTPSPATWAREVPAERRFMRSIRYCSERMASSSASGSRTTGPRVSTWARRIVPWNGKGAV
jgi:hypothetical protein